VIFFGGICFDRETKIFARVPVRLYSTSRRTLSGHNYRQKRPTSRWETSVRRPSPENRNPAFVATALHRRNIWPRSDNIIMRYRFVYNDVKLYIHLGPMRGVRTYRNRGQDSRTVGSACPAAGRMRDRLSGFALRSPRRRTAEGIIIIVLGTFWHNDKPPYSKNDSASVQYYNIVHCSFRVYSECLIYIMLIQYRT